MICHTLWCRIISCFEKFQLSAVFFSFPFIFLYLLSYYPIFPYLLSVLLSFFSFYLFSLIPQTLVLKLELFSFLFYFPFLIPLTFCISSFSNLIFPQTNEIFSSLTTQHNSFSTPLLELLPTSTHDYKILVRCFWLV